MAQPPSTLRHALLEPAHIAGLVLAFLALFFFRFATPVIALVAVLELFYLLVFARSSAYARRVQLKAAGEADSSRLEALSMRAAQLNREERRRYQAIDRLYQEIEAQLQAVGDTTLLALDRGQLLQLKSDALELALALQNIREHLKKNSPEKVREELARLADQPAAAGPVAEAQRQTRELLEKRLEHLSAMESQSLVADAQLQVLEQTFRLLKEQLSAMRTPAQLPAAANVTALVHDVEATRRTLQEMGAFELSAQGRLPS